MCNNVLSFTVQSSLWWFTAILASHTSIRSQGKTSCRNFLPQHFQKLCYHHKGGDISWAILREFLFALEQSREIIHPIFSAPDFKDNFGEPFMLKLILTMYTRVRRKSQADRQKHENTINFKNMSVKSDTNLLCTVLLFTGRIWALRPILSCTILCNFTASASQKTATTARKNI